MQFGAARACRALRDDPAQCVRAYAGDACAGDVDGVQGMMDGHCIAEVWSNWRYEHIHANLRFTTLLTSTLFIRYIPTSRHIRICLEGPICSGRYQ